MSRIEDATHEPIAIIGMSCRFPGAESPDALWKMIVERRESVAEYPDGRTPEMDEFYRRVGKADGPISRRGGFLRDIHGFDAGFFEVSPREAEWIDPQQRLLLESSWEALENAGISRDMLSKEKTGVFAGVWLSEYEHHAKANAPVSEFFLITGGPLFGISSRISFQFDLRGPDISANAACGSSLVAVHLATRSLRSGECSLALAGGVNIQVRHECTQAFSRAKMLAPDGRCKFGAADADGFVRSDGVGMLVLKRLSDATRDGDRIQGLIRGTGMTNDGRGSGYLATPSSSGQRDAMFAAVGDARIDPKTVDYVEAHGSGSRAGDPVELSAIGSVFGRPGDEQNYCRTGSVKSNIGHAESAAGVAGIIRAVEAMQNEQFPASLHADELNPAIDWEALGVRLQRDVTRWETKGYPRRASVNGLSLTGTNTHVILEEAPEQTHFSREKPEAYLLMLSGACDNSLRQRAKDLARAIKDFSRKDDIDSWIYDACYTASARRTHLSHRLAIAGVDAVSVLNHLEASAAGEDSPFSAKGVVENGRQPKIAFVFPGQGSQWVGMGRELLRSQQVFRRVIEDLDAAIAVETGWSLMSQLEDSALDERLTRIDVIQPTLFAMEVALAELWRSWGVVPEAVIGHSMGEVAAACVAGTLSYKDAAAIICRRSALLMRVAGAGAMVVVDLPHAEAQRQIAGFEEKVSVAVSNSPRSTVLAGDPAVLDGIVQRLEAEDVFCRWVRVDVASHSPQMDPLKAELLATLAEVQPQTGTIPVCSTVQAAFMEPAEMDAHYWVSNLREPVLFARGVEELLKQGFDTFIEMSPHPILVPFVEQTAEAAGATALSVGSLRREEPETATILMAAGRLHVAGAALDWNAIYPAGNLTDLPSYPWQRERFWIESTEAKLNRFLSSKGHPILGEPLTTATNEYVWTGSISTESHPWLRDHAVNGRTLLPASVYVEMAAAAGKLIFGDTASSLDRLNLIESVPLVDGKILEMQAIATPDSQDEFAIRFFRRESADEDWTKSAECVIRRPTNEAEEVVNLTAWEDAEFSLNASSGGDHAESMRNFGYDFGPAFHQIDWLAMFDHTALARIALPLEMQAEDYLMHPATLDAALQVVGRLLLESAGGREALLPVSVESIDWSGSSARGKGLYVRSTINAARLSGDVEVFDERGRWVLRVRGLLFRPFAIGDAARIEEARFEIVWEPLKIARRGSESPSRGNWLLVGGDSGNAKQLASAFALQNAEAEVISTEEFLSEQYAVNPGLKGVIWLDPLTLAGESSLGDTQVILAKGASVVTKVASLEDQEISGTRLWAVTANTQAVTGDEEVEVQGAGTWGFFASVSNEYPSLHASSINISSRIIQAEADALAGIVLSDIEEERVALRSGAAYCQRLVRNHRAERTETSQGVSVREDEGFELAQRVSGTLTGFELVSASEREPGHGEIEIAVEAAGLNFNDVLKAIASSSSLSGSHFGEECSGRVVRVGSGVKRLKVGDVVLAIAPAFDKTGMFGSRAVVPEDLAFRKPDSMTFAEAAGIPCAFLTAWYALMKLARLERGESVLIHSAASSIGLAAIQIAKWIGAEIFATVGTDEQRACMERLGVKHIMHSRKLDFSREIMAATDGVGVDVVLNSLAGPAITAGLESLASYGRFVEIGKRDILENSQVGLKPFDRNLSMFAVNLAQLVEDRRATVSSMFGELMRLLEDGVFSPLPSVVFPISAAGEAFERMTKDVHIGKIVLQVRDCPVKVRRDRSRLSPDATYLITGVAGWLELGIAQTMVEVGARHLVLVSSQSATSELVTEFKELEATGAKIAFRKAGLGDASEMDALLQEIRESMPPLRGIVHAAGVLDDAMVPDLTQMKFATAMAGRVDGALALDSHIGADELDFLVYYSSAAGILGNPGQGNYAAANAMLNALAHKQRSRGVPAISIAWGMWSEVGLSAAGEDRGARMAHRGITSLSRKEGSSLLMQVLNDAPTQAICMHFDAEAWCEVHPGAERSGLFAKLLDKRRASSGESDDFTAGLRRLSGEEMHAVLMPWLRQQVASVLRLGIERVPVDKPMRALGLDSLMALELRNRLERLLHCKLSATLAWNYPTVAAVAAHLQVKLEAVRNAGIEEEKKVVSKEPVVSAVAMSAVPNKDEDAAASGSIADILEAELLGAEYLLNTLESSN